MKIPPKIPMEIKCYVLLFHIYSLLYQNQKIQGQRKNTIKGSHFFISSHKVLPAQNKIFLFCFKAPDSHLLAEGNWPLITTSYIFTCKSLESQACPISIFISHLQAVRKHFCTSTEGLTFNLPVS